MVNNSIIFAKVGTKNTPKFDIAVDPLEGTNFAANNLPGAISVIAVSEKNNLFNAPETYMDKISTRVEERNVIDLDFSVKKNIYNLSEYLNKKPENLTSAKVFSDPPMNIAEINKNGDTCKLSDNNVQWKTALKIKDEDEKIKQYILCRDEVKSFCIDFIDKNF